MEKPILFKGNMIIAILKLIKRNTRRLNGFKVINKHPDKWKFIRLVTDLNGKSGLWAEFLGEGSLSPIYIECPWEVGTHLWVRETWACVAGEASNVSSDNDTIYYECDRKYKIVPHCRYRQYDGKPIKWRPSIHMPRFASRITLEVKEIRVERLQDISEDGAKSEGVLPVPFCVGDNYYRESFMQLWDEINVDRGFGWRTNPYVWVVSFESI